MIHHTPGLWRVDADGCLRRVADGIMEDTNLFTAAPDLLAALRMICDSGVALADPIEKAMLAAIAKAEGK